MGISQLIQAGSFDGHFCTFIDGKCYIPELLHGNVVRHTWTLSNVAASQIHKRQCPTCSKCEDKGYYIYRIFQSTRPKLLPRYWSLLRGQCSSISRRQRYCHGNGHTEWDLVWPCLWSECWECHTESQWFQETRRQGVWTLTFHVDTVHFAPLLGRVQTRKYSVDFAFSNQSNLLQRIVLLILYSWKCGCSWCTEPLDMSNCSSFPEFYHPQSSCNASEVLRISSDWEVGSIYGGNQNNDFRIFVGRKVRQLLSQVVCKNDY